MKKDKSFKEEVENSIRIGGFLYKPDEDVIKLREFKLKNKQKEVVYISRIGTEKCARITIYGDEFFNVDAKYQQKEMKEHIDKTSDQYILKQEMREYTDEERNIAREIMENMKPIEEYEDKSLYYKEYDDKKKEANIPSLPQYLFTYITDNPIYGFTPDMFEFREKETNRLLKYKNIKIWKN